jgi:hypothetical protein
MPKALHIIIIIIIIIVIIITIVIIIIIPTGIPKSRVTTLCAGSS